MSPQSLIALALLMGAILSQSRSSTQLHRSGAGGGHHWNTTSSRAAPKLHRSSLIHPGLYRRSLIDSLEPKSSLVVFGPTRSGKTRDVLAPVLQHWPGSAIVTSVKDDIVNLTISSRTSSSTVRRLGVGAVGAPDLIWDPVLDCTGFEASQKVAHALVSSQSGFAAASSESRFWYTLAERALAPLLLASCHEGAGLELVSNWLSGANLEPAIVVLNELGDRGAIASLDSMKFWDERQFSSVILTLTAVLDPITAALGGLSAGVKSVSIGYLIGTTENFTIYLTSSLAAQRRLAPYFAALNTLLIEAVMSRNLSSGHPSEVLVILDEAANTAPLAELAEIASVGAGLGVFLLTALQDLSQLRVCYGSAANTVVNNHKSKLFLPGISDPETLALAETLLGPHPEGLGHVHLREQSVGTAMLIQGRSSPRSVRLNARRWPFSREFR